MPENTLLCRLLGLGAMVLAALFMTGLVVRDRRIEGLATLQSFKDMATTQTESASRNVASGQLTSGSLRTDQENVIMALEDNIRKYIASKVLDRTSDGKRQPTNPLFASDIQAWGDAEYDLIAKLNRLEEFRETLNSCMKTLDSVPQS